MKQIVKIKNKKVNFSNKNMFNLSNTENTVKMHCLPLIMNVSRNAIYRAGLRYVSWPNVSIYRHIISSLLFS